MKLSNEWLREWVNPSLDNQTLEARFTMAGFEVDSRAPIAPPFSNIEVALVKTTAPHPDATRLTLCKVEVGEGSIIDIVCGAPNVRPDLKVALARIGASLPNGLVIKEAKLRGAPSFGMLCSGEELGLVDTNEGILELPQDAPIGVSLREYLSLDDEIFELDVTPNRGDCLSVHGIARDIAAWTNTLCKPCDIQKIPPRIDEKRPVHLEAKNACPRYAMRIIRDIDSSQKTPHWMTERLRRAGIRPIHPAVDVVNYVMMELGQPMHVFDLEKIEGDIFVRQAKPAESLTLLDDRTVSLDETVTVIADEKGPLAIAGVMGGALSATSETTQHILLESAFFEPTIIGPTARRFDALSESAQRFQRGVSWELQEKALERATALLLDITKGTPSDIHVTEISELLPLKPVVLFNPGSVFRLTGVEIETAAMKDYFLKLGFSVDDSETLWKVNAPAHRFDISIEADLIEEILRLYGYDKIKASPMQGVFKKASVNPIDKLARTFSNFLVARGFRETISYSFVDPLLQSQIHPDIEPLSLVNPISRSLSVMRTSLWPGLLASLIHNMHRQERSLRLFEYGVVFHDSEKGMQELPQFSGLLTGQQGELNWFQQKWDFDFFDLKGTLQGLFSLLGLAVQFQPISHPALHPSQSAMIEVEGKSIGLMGVLHPELADMLDLDQNVQLFEINLSLLQEKSRARFEAISKFPQVRRDLAFLVKDNILFDDIKNAILSLEFNELRSIDVFDIYVGPSIPSNEKSIALSLSFQDTTKTLVDETIHAMIDAIIKKLAAQFAMTLRELS